MTLLSSLSMYHTKGQAVILTPAENNLYNTGYNGTTLAGDNQLDTHYTITNYVTSQTFQANPLAAGWVANPSDAQWITISNTTNVGPTTTFDYQLKLTNIPVGSVVTISGLIAADDNATISANSKSPVFNSLSQNGGAGSIYNAITNFGTLTFVAGKNNYITIVVSNNGGGPTGLNLQLDGSYVPLASTVGLNLKLTPPHLTQNQTAVLNSINAINAVGTTNKCFVNLTQSLLGASAGQIGPDLDQLSPERLGVLSTIAFNDASFRTQDLDDYLAHRRNAQGNLQVFPDHIDTSGLTLNDPTMDPSLSQINGHLLAWNPAPQAHGYLRDVDNSLGATLAPPKDDFYNNWNLFLRGNVTLGQDFSQPEIDHTDYTTSSFELGSDYQLSQNFLVGALFDYSHTDTALDSNGSTATVDGYSPGVFASFADGGWFANALGTYSWNSYTTARHIGFGSFDETASGAPTGNEELGNLDGGYEFHSKRWTFGPTAGIQYVHFNVDPFTESGGCSSDLSVDNQADDSLRSRLGGRVSYALPDRDNRVIFTPYLDASWQHEFLDGSRCITSSFSEFNAGPIVVSTPDTSRDSALIVVGLDADLTRSMTLFTDYAAQAGADNYFGQSIQAGMKVAF